MEQSSTAISAAVIRAASLIGSQKALAAALGVSPQAVWAWIKRGSVPATYCFAIEETTEGIVSRRLLRPADFHLIWPELARRHQTPKRRSSAMTSVNKAHRTAATAKGK